MAELAGLAIGQVRTGRLVIAIRTPVLRRAVHDGSALLSFELLRDFLPC